MAIPESFLNRIHALPDEKTRTQVLCQFLPLSEGKEETNASFTCDPLGEQADAKEGFLHRYPGRLLVMTTMECGARCQFCFRQHWPSNMSSKCTVAKVLQYLKQEPTVSEVLLSGGDPLTLPVEELREWSQALANLPQVKRLRVHSRLPVLTPEVLTPELLDWFTTIPQQPVLVLHTNHPAELSDALFEKLAVLRRSSVTLLAQSVLLRGVNNAIETLATLFERLISGGVQPYYLHQLDRVAGASRFEVPVEEGLALHEELRQRLPGYALPRYVQEIPGEGKKTVTKASEL